MASVKSYTNINIAMIIAIGIQCFEEIIIVPIFLCPLRKLKTIEPYEDIKGMKIMRYNKPKG